MLKDRRQASRTAEIITLDEFRPPTPVSSARSMVTLSIVVEVTTRAQVEILLLRDGVSMAEYQKRAAQAYALMLPGWPYPR